MNITNDISWNTLIISAVVAVCAWILKGIGKLVVKSVEAAIAYMIQLIKKVETLDSKMIQLNDAVSDHEKLRGDINQYYKQHRELRAEFEKFKIEN